MNYNNRRFKVAQVSESGEVSTDLIFQYKQQNNILNCNYSGGQIKAGQLIGLVNERGEINMSYQQINLNDQIRTGICHSVPEITKSGKIRLHETWQWTNGNLSKGTSILEEI